MITNGNRCIGYHYCYQLQVGINGLLSFDTPYDSWFNQPFPLVFTPYLVAPFWDDADITGGNGQISYEIHQSGYYLDHVSSFIRARNPSEFQGTWMMVIFWDAIHPYPGTFTNEVRVLEYSSDNFLTFFVLLPIRKTPSKPF